MIRTSDILACAVVVALALGATPKSFAADDPVATKLKAWDPDHDGTIDLAEAKKAGEARFVELNPDNDGTLDAKEAAGAKITAQALAQADPDHDGTLDQNEYFTVLEERFKAADPDHDGTVSLSELKTQAGKALMVMMK